MSNQSVVTVLGIDVDRLPLEGWRLDAVFSLLGAWLIIGVTWDFGNHAAGIDFAEEGFLTAPHVTFYSAAVAIGVLVAASVLARGQKLARDKGPRSIMAAIPEGYSLAILGLVLFGLGGPLDFGWHLAFGAESGVEALTSPTHLTLATGAVLFLSSPLRAAWVRPEDRASLRGQLPMLTSGAFVVISIAAFAMYGNPLFQPIAAGAHGEPLGLVQGMTPDHGVLSVAAFSALVFGMVLSLVDRFDVATGGFTYVFTLIALPFTGAVGFAFLPVMSVTGIAIDGFTALVELAGTHWFRVLAGVGPLVLFGSYFLVHSQIWGIAWSPHVWLGAIVVGVLVGILVSFLVRPTTGADTQSVR